MMARVRRGTPPAVDETMLDPAAWPEWVLSPPMQHDPRPGLFGDAQAAEAAEAEDQTWRERRRAWVREHRPDLIRQHHGRDNYGPFNSAVMRERHRRLHSGQAT